MRKIRIAPLALVAVLGLLGIWSMAAAPYGTGGVAAGQTTGAAPAKAPAPEVKAEAAAEEPKVYIPAAPDNLNRFPQDFQGQYVQVPDYFGERVDANKFPSEVTRNGITSRTHFGFTTHRASGSNMICFVSRENKEAQEFFNTPLPPETPIYLLGRVGPKLFTDYGGTPVMLVDRVVRGHSAPPPLVEAKKKPIRFVLEWQTETGPKSQTYTIPEPGKKYVIPDPYNPARKMYMTFEF